MLNKLETATMVNERVTCNACLLMVRLCKSTVNDHKSATCLNWTFTCYHMNRNVTVYNVTVLTRYAKCVHYAVNSLLVITQTEEVAFLLNVRLLFADEVTLKGSHLRFVEQRRVFSAPQIEKVILGVLLLFLRSVALEGRADKQSCLMQQILASVFLARTNLYLLQ